MRGSVGTTGVDAGSAGRRARLAVALLVLLVGTLVYVLDRPAESVPFFSAISVSHFLPGIFGPLGDSLPTFAHVFALSVLTAVWFGGGARAASDGSTFSIVACRLN